MKRHSLYCFIISFLFISVSLKAQKQWWLDEPVRLLQTNLPMHMVPDYNAEELANEVVQSGANTWLFNVGGIFSYYPTKLDFQTVNPHMDPKRDFAGELVDAGRKKGLKIIGRYDFSRFPSAIAKAHPEWAFRRPNGETISFNDLVTACVFTDYYQEHAIKAIEEGMQRYNLDGLLINWWGNHGTNSYIGVPNGVCHCNSCKTKWAEISFEPLPFEPTPEYNAWHKKVKSDLENRIQKMVDKYNKNSALIIYHLTGNRETLEGFTTETKTGIPSNTWWLYQSSYYVNKYRNSYPDKGTFNTVVNFLNFNYRFAPHRKMANQTRMLQSMAHGTFPAFYMIGMPSQFDTTGAAAINYPFKVHKENEKYFVHQESVAEIVLLDDMLSDNMKGLINILSESHLPHKIVLEEKLKNHLENTNLIISTSGASESLLEVVEKGKNLIVIGNQFPEIFADDVIGLVESKDLNKSYWAIHDQKIFPETSKRRIIYNTSDYTELKQDANASIKLIPTAMSAPPELAGNGMKTSDKPGLIIKKHGKGTIAYIPWNLTSMYYEQATTSINLLLNELVDHLTDNKRQVVTDAHPLVEISLMKNTDENVHLFHLINNTAQLHGSLDTLIPLQNLNFKIKGSFKNVYDSKRNKISSKTENGYTIFTVKQLDAYEFVVLD